MSMWGKTKYVVYHIISVLLLIIPYIADIITFNRFRMWDKIMAVVCDTVKNIDMDEMAETLDIKEFYDDLEK